MSTPAPIRPWILPIFGMAHLGFGFMITCGALMEVLNMLFPALIPTIQDHPFMRIHHSEPVLAAWTVGSNVLNGAAGLGLVSAGLGIFGRRPWVPRLSRRSAQLLVAVAAGGLLVCAVFLYPVALAELRAADPAARKQGLWLLVSMVAAGFLLPVYPGIVWWTFGRPRIRALFAAAGKD